MVYERSKNEGGVRPFGSLQKFYENDFVWLNHSISPSHIRDQNFKIMVGNGKNSYHMSVLNISGTSFGAISPPAITSLNKAAKWVDLLIILGKARYPLITRQVKEMLFGKFQQDTLDVEIKKVIFVQKHSLRSLKKTGKND